MNSTTQTIRHYTTTTTTATTTNRRLKRRHSSTEQQQPNKDLFIDLAQAALLDADREEEKKGVIHEVMEALIAKTGAPLVAEVISEQLKSQDVIEKIAEQCEQDEKRRRLINNNNNNNEQQQLLLATRTDSMDSLKEPEDSVEAETTLAAATVSSEPPTMAEYLWRFFRVLILASLVGLVYHFLSA